MLGLLTSTLSWPVTCLYSLCMKSVPISAQCIINISKHIICYIFEIHNLNTEGIDVGWSRFLLVAWKWWTEPWPNWFSSGGCDEGYVHVSTSTRSTVWFKKGCNIIQEFGSWSQFGGDSLYKDIPHSMIMMIKYYCTILQRYYLTCTKNNYGKWIGTHMMMINKRLTTWDLGNASSFLWICYIIE